VAHLEAQPCEALALSGFWVIRFDNRDAGKSTRFDRAGIPDVAVAMTRAWMRMSVSARYLPDDTAADVVGLMDALHIEKAHMVGASMGGGIAQVLAMNWPQRVFSLTSIMSTTGDPSLPPPKPAAMAAMFKTPPAGLDEYIEHYVQLSLCVQVDLQKKRSAIAPEPFATKRGGLTQPERRASWWPSSVQEADEARLGMSQCQRSSSTATWILSCRLPPAQIRRITYPEQSSW